MIEGSVDLIQLRAKTSSVEQIRRMAEAILPVTRKADVGLVINDYLSVAWELGTEFCHLGQEDFFDAGFPAGSDDDAVQKKVRRAAHLM